MQDQSIPEIDGSVIGNRRSNLHQDAIAHLDFFWLHLRKTYFFEVVDVQVLTTFPPIIKAHEVWKHNPTLRLEPVPQ